MLVVKFHFYSTGVAVSFPGKCVENLCTGLTTLLLNHLTQNWVFTI